ncbi:hypothetical protein ACLOJK_025781 [Asimina triloba]
MDRYQRVEKPRAETPINENEIRITTQGRMRNYITYATSLLQVFPGFPFGFCRSDTVLFLLDSVLILKVLIFSLLAAWDALLHWVLLLLALLMVREKGSDEIVFKAMGRAINKTVMIVELIKRRIVGLHQNTSIGSTDITDTWEPLEEGLLPLETTRHVSMVTITLSKKELDTSSVGYQSPLPAEQVKPLVDFDYEGGGDVVAEVAEEGSEETVTWVVNMEMEVGTGAVDMLGAGVVEEAVAFVVVDEVDMVVLLIHNTILAAIMMMVLLPAAVQVVVVGGDRIAGEVVTSDRMDRLMLLQAEHTRILEIRGT